MNPCDVSNTQRMLIIHHMHCVHVKIIMVMMRFQVLVRIILYSLCQSEKQLVHLEYLLPPLLVDKYHLLYKTLCFLRGVLSRMSNKMVKLEMVEGTNIV